jgi:hypothetical protein
MCSALLAGALGAHDSLPLPEETRQQLANELGRGPFLILRYRVQEDLRLSTEQAEDLGEELRERIPEARQLLMKVQSLKPHERPQALETLRREAQKDLWEGLREFLTREQLKRLRQIALQQEGLFALGRPDASEELKLTDEQRRQYAAVVEELNKAVESLVKEAQAAGKPESVAPQVMQVRKEHAERIEAILSDVQKQKWQEMLGPALKLEG